MCLGAASGGSVTLLFRRCLAVAACITAGRICLWFARGARLLWRGFSRIYAKRDCGHCRLFNRWLWFGHMANAWLGTFCAWARLWGGNKACIGIGKIIQASHQAGLWIEIARLGACFGPVIAARFRAGL